jgi:RNA polymerase sigma factor for flagellar operon FliA
VVEITREHMAFVERIAWKHSVPENFDDLCGYGMIGLVQAARRFDPSEGPNFLAYASRRIRGAVIDGARELDRLSRRDRHRDDELGDLARSRAGGALELDVPTACEDGEAETYALIADPSAPDPLDEAIATDQQDRLAAAVEHATAELTEVQATVIGFRYHAEMTQREIGETLGVTESRICQVLGRAHERLAEHREVRALRRAA